MTDSPALRWASKADAFSSLVRRIMAVENPDNIRAFLLSYPIYLTEENILAALWCSEFSKAINKEKEALNGQYLKKLPSERMLAFLRIWMELYPHDLTTEEHSQVLMTLKNENQQNVVNEFKLVFMKNQSILRTLKKAGQEPLPLPRIHIEKTTPETTGKEDTKPDEEESNHDAKHRKHKKDKKDKKVKKRHTKGDQQTTEEGSSTKEASSDKKRLGTDAPTSATSLKDMIEYLKTEKKKERAGTDSRSQPEPTKKVTLRRVNSTPRHFSSPPAAQQEKKRLTPTVRVKLGFFDCPALPLARELTMAEFEIYKDISPREFILKARDNSYAPNIMRLINRFNFIGNWIATEILTKNQKAQVQVVNRLIKVAVYCLKLGNFNSLMEIVSGLNSSAITRLKALWEDIDEKRKIQLQELEKLMDSRHGFSTYKEALERRSQSADPILPYLPVYLGYFSSMHEGNAAYSEDGSINFDLIMMQWNTVQNIIQYQKKPYNLPRNKLVQQFMEHLDPVKDQETLHSMSLAYYPSEIPPAVYAPQDVTPEPPREKEERREKRSRSRRSLKELIHQDKGDESTKDVGRTPTIDLSPRLKEIALGGAKSEECASLPSTRSKKSSSKGKAAGRPTSEPVFPRNKASSEESKKVLDDIFKRILEAEAEIEETDTESTTPRSISNSCGNLELHERNPPKEKKKKKHKTKTKPKHEDS